MMINLIAHAGSVSFGYISEMSQSELDCNSDSGFDLHRLTAYPRGVPEHLLRDLPDLVLSNTPPASPLRRSQSHHFLFPSEPKLRTRETVSSITGQNLHPAEAQAPSDNSRGRMGGDGGRRRESPAGGLGRAHSVGGLAEEEAPTVRSGVEHIQEVRRVLQHQHHHQQQNLPPLSWEVPRFDNNYPQPYQRVEEILRDEDGEGRREEEAEEEDGGVTPARRRWRDAGRALRRIADDFAVNNSKASSAKNDNDAPLNLSVPVALTRCLSATLLCLVWWRLLNKFR